MACMGIDFYIPLMATGAVNDLLAMRAAGAARNAFEATRPIAREIYMVRKRKAVSPPLQSTQIYLAEKKKTLVAQIAPGRTSLLPTLLVVSCRCVCVCVCS